MWVALRFSLVTLILAGVVYPLLITGLGQSLFPYQANGSLVTTQSGQAIGSELIGQIFTLPQYFHPRPSANQYDGTNSGGSNYGATNRKLIQRVSDDTLHYTQANHTTTIPIDAVTTSASGLDPDISLANARQQAGRVAAARHISQRQILKLIEAHTIRAMLSDAPTVRVLALNLDLNRTFPISH